MTDMRNQQLVRLQRFASVDFESAGTMRGSTDFPVQIGIACWSYEKGWEPGFVSYLHCPHEVSWQASRVHGISTSDLSDAPRLIDLWPEIRSRLFGSVIVAHARGTEKKFLRSFPGHGFGPWIDTLVWARRIWPEMTNHTLSNACHQAQILDELQDLCPNRSWHDALYDATASMALIRQWILTQDLLNSPIDLLIQE